MTVSVRGLLPRMVAMPSKEAPLVSSWHTRLVIEAAEITRNEGWSSVTMARLADKVGVSRQTVYNELGSKDGLAEAMVMHELVGFLAEVEVAFKKHPDDLVAAIRQAAYDVLVMARSNPLLHAILSASHGAESELLPLLTTQSEPLIEAAQLVILDQMSGFEIDLTADELRDVVDSVVRLVLSHVMLQGRTPEATADSIAWLAARVLGQSRSR